MTTLSFNTHTYIKRLIGKGMKESLAEEVAEGLLESRNIDLNNLVTKDYLDAKLFSTDAKINSLRSELIRWQISISFIATTALGGFIWGSFKLYLGKNIG